MSEGLWFLKDGRGYIRQMGLMVKLLRGIHTELSLTEGTEEFSEYLSKFIFTKAEDGKFYNEETRESAIMEIDLREFTPSNQDVFWEAVKGRLNKLIKKNSIKDRTLIREFKILLDMNKRANNGEDPRKLNHLRYPAPPTGEKKGPGWDD